MLVSYRVTKVDLEAGFVVVHVDYEGGISGDYTIEVEAFATSDHDPEQMVKTALDSVVKQIAARAFPPPQPKPPTLLALEGWTNEFFQP